MPAIKATNSSELRVENCKFEGFETDIELENVDGFVSKNNQFSKQNNPKLLLSGLFDEIRNSGFDRSSKERLASEVKYFLAKKNFDNKKKEDLENRLKYIGDKALDFFVQLVAAVAAGLMVR